jgi:hypothetical protein
MPSNSIVRYLLPRTRDILFLLVFWVAIAAGWRTLNSDSDLPRHLLMGQVIVESRTVPQTELFSHVYAGRTYVAHEWLSALAYYTAYAALGFQGVVLLTAVVLASTFYILYAALAGEHQEYLLLFLIVLLGVANSFQHWIARPHLFSMFFLALWLIEADAIGRGRGVALWRLPALALVWGNLHAEFIAGFLVLIAYGAGWLWDFCFQRQNADPQVIRRLGAVFLLAFLASLVNPFGIRTWSATLGYLGNRYLMSTIIETRAPDFSSPAFLIELILIAASLLVLSLKRGPLHSGQAFLLTGFTVLAMTSGRNIHLYAIVAPFVLAGPAIAAMDSALLRRSAAALTRIESQLRGCVWPVVAVLTALMLLIGGRLGSDYRLDPQRFPVQALRWLQANPQSGQMFNDFAWGSYLVWQLWPEHRDFIDSHTDMTGEATRIYHSVLDLEDGWQQTLDRFQVQWVIVRVDSELSQALQTQGWRELYRDPLAIILRRD